MASIPLMYAQEDCELGGKENIEVRFRWFRHCSKLFCTLLAAGIQISECINIVTLWRRRFYQFYSLLFIALDFMPLYQ